jgi:hypothetical protein
MTEKRNTRLAVSSAELERIKEAKETVYGENADDIPHAMFLVEAAERWAKTEQFA